MAIAFTAGLLGPAGTAAAEDDILHRLKGIPGLTVISENVPPAPGYRHFTLNYTQPVDHRKPDGAKFEQRLALLHKSSDLPMVLNTTGYDLYVSLAEPTRLLGSNQITTEQRFFGTSVPGPITPDTLNIWQAATDHHRLVTAFKPLYQRKWIASGASKGGVTSVYHRRYYSRDVDGVVAYVAPNDHNNPEDSAYDEFFAKAGTDPACRTTLENLQIEAFKRRSELVAKYEAIAAENGWTFTKVVGSADKAFEKTIVGLGWAFWQSWPQAECANIPPVTATVDELYDYVDKISFGSFGFYTDQGLTPYVPYYYQSITQLGWPQPQFSHIRAYLRYPDTRQNSSSVPPDLRHEHQPWPMIDIDRWVRLASSRLLFVYGENDPWGAEPFTPSDNDSYRFVAPGTNHRANIAALTPADRDTANAALRRWADLDAASFDTAEQFTRPEPSEPLNPVRPF